MHLKFKFKVNVILFFIEQNRINYIRDYYKLITFNIIKARYLKNNINFYVIALKMFKDLNNIYNEFNLYEIFDARLHNSNFNIKKTKHLINFLIKFTIIITLL